jgi:hypothetical protein
MFWLSQFRSERQDWLTFPQHGTAAMSKADPQGW